jgi:hypothetical protein
VLGLLGLAGYSSYLRVTNGNTSLEDEYEDDLVETLTDGKLGDYFFLVRFGVELVLAWFVFFPIVSTVFFSGLLGCCEKLPLLGGRPRDKRMMEEGMRDAIIMPDTNGSLVRHAYKNIPGKMGWLVFRSGFPIGIERPSVRFVGMLVSEMHEHHTRIG